MRERIETLIWDSHADLFHGDAALGDIVRGILVAMREPTDAMLRAATSDTPDGPFETDARAIWQAMIDEALK